MPAPVENIIVEPIHVPISQATVLTGESRSSLYIALKRGELSAVRVGDRTCLIYAELKARALARPIITQFVERPQLRKARERYNAQQKKQTAKRRAK